MTEQQQSREPGEQRGASEGRASPLRLGIVHRDGRPHFVVEADPDGTVPLRSRILARVDDAGLTPELVKRVNGMAAEHEALLGCTTRCRQTRWPVTMASTSARPAPPPGPP